MASSCPLAVSSNWLRGGKCEELSASGLWKESFERGSVPGLLHIALDSSELGYHALANLILSRSQRLPKEVKGLLN